MIGNFLTRGLVMIFGYAYPAYECFKTVEKNKPEIEQLRFWCQYWILVALMTVFERIGDTFVSWVPMYSEAKLAFFIYLWHPKTKGTTYVYDSFFRPYVTKHEMEIDHSLLELRTRAGDIAVLYWQKAASYGQTRVFEVLQYVAAQSTPRPRSAQPQQQNPRTRQPSTTAPAAPTATAATAPPSRQPSTRTQVTQPQNEDPPSPTSSTASSHLQKQLQENEEPSSSQAPSASAAIALPPKSPLKKAISMPTPESSSQSATTGESESMRIEPVPPQPEKAAALAPPVSEETAMEEAIRVTRARLRNARSTSK